MTNWVPSKWWCHWLTAYNTARSSFSYTNFDWLRKLNALLMKAMGSFFLHYNIFNTLVIGISLHCKRISNFHRCNGGLEVMASLVVGKLCWHPYSTKMHPFSVNQWVALWWFHNVEWISNLSNPKILLSSIKVFGGDQFAIALIFLRPVFTHYWEMIWPKNSTSVWTNQYLHCLAYNLWTFNSLNTSSNCL